LIALGRLDEAEDRIRQNLAATRTAGMRHWEGATLRSRGLLHLTRGATESARDDFEGTVTIFDDLGSRIELGRTLVLRAPLSTNPDEDLDRARALFEACGASADLIQLG